MVSTIFDASEVDRTKCKKKGIATSIREEIAQCLISPTDVPVVLHFKSRVVPSWPFEAPLALRGRGRHAMMRHDEVAGW